MKLHDDASLQHLDRMTDSTGLVQHAIYSLPRRESGYTTDDNARALRLCARLWKHRPDERMRERVSCYLSFLEHARTTTSGGFHNFMSYDRQWLDAEGCGDCQGQAVRALAEVLASDLGDDFTSLCRELIDDVLPALANLRSLRAQAYIVLAWGRLWASNVKNIEPLEAVAWSAANRLAESYSRSCRQKWSWYESRLTYANAVLPHAMFVAARRWPTENFHDIAQTSFAFLDRETTIDGMYSPVGNHGWYSRGENRAHFDQQPVEAAVMADAALAAFELSDDAAYLAVFRRSRDWFHGQNSLAQSLVDVGRGACCDGLAPHGVNRNQGAESTLAFLWCELQYHAVQQMLGGEQPFSAAIA